MARSGRNGFHLLALVVFVVALAFAILLPGEAEIVEDRRGDLDTTPDVVNARVPLRIAIGLGGFALAGFLVWLGNREPAAAAPGERRETRPGAQSG